MRRHHKMKTSPSQFDLLVTYMEQHGDISKPSSNAKGRISSMRKWEELTSILNSDSSGDTKTSEKWKKVWSDYKNNTKKKAARLHKAASGTFGGPALHTKLTDLEQRVLNLIGVQAATGLAVKEAGLPQRILPDSAAPSTPTPPLPPVHSNPVEDDSESWNAPEPSTRQHVRPPPPASEPASPISFIAAELASLEYPNASLPQPRPTSNGRPTSNSSFFFAEVQDVNIATPTIAPSQRDIPQPLLPALTGHTRYRRNRQTRRRSPHRRIVRPAEAEQAAQQFLHADEEWRNFIRSQHDDNMSMRREQNRIRELELQSQRDWQRIGNRLLDIFDNLINKYLSKT